MTLFCELLKMGELSVLPIISSCGTRIHFLQVWVYTFLVCIVTLVWGTSQFVVQIVILVWFGVHHSLLCRYINTGFRFTAACCVDGSVGLGVHHSLFCG